MIDYGKTKSTIKPKPLVIDDFSVWEYTNIKEYTEPENDFFGYEYNMKQYGKNEFILIQAEENAKLAEEITNVQMVLCDIYEQTQ